MDDEPGADPTGPTLDEEGIPDLQGPLAGKVATGDPQEGEPPPSAHPVSRDWGVTPAEARHGEPLSVRVAREQPDFGATDAPRGSAEAVVLVDDAVEDLASLADDDGAEGNLGADIEKEAVGRAVHQPGLLIAPEDAAIHLVDDGDVLDSVEDVDDMDVDLDGNVDLDLARDVMDVADDPSSR